MQVDMLPNGDVTLPFASEPLEGGEGGPSELIDASLLLPLNTKLSSIFTVFNYYVQSFTDDVAGKEFCGWRVRPACRHRQ